MSPRTTCRNCGDELWTAAEAHGLCSGCTDFEVDGDELEALLDRAADELEEEDHG